MSHKEFILGTRALEDMKANPDKIYTYQGFWFQFKDNTLWSVHLGIPGHYWQESKLPISCFLDQFWLPIPETNYPLVSKLPYIRK